MTRILVDELHEGRMKDPDYRREYEALEEEFRHADASIAARAQDKLTQEKQKPKTGSA